MTQLGPIPHWIPNEWREIKHGEINCYLGIPFSLGVSLFEMWAWFLNRLKNKLFEFGNKFVSLPSRIQVSNRILIATHVYY